MAHLTGSLGYPQATSVAIAYSSLIPAKISLGTRARDAAGNEYVYVDFDAAKDIGEIVTWDTDYLATDTSATGTGYIGVVCATVASSDMAGWVQVYGVNTHVLASSSLTSGGLQVAGTTDGWSVPENTTNSTGHLYRIAGMNAATSASTVLTTANAGSSLLGVFTAILNYPYVVPDIATS